MAMLAARVQTSQNRRVGLEEHDAKLVNFDRSVWLDHSRSRSLAAVHFQPRAFPGLRSRLQSTVGLARG
jgi:hypothetical protein